MSIYLPIGLYIIAAAIGYRAIKLTPSYLNTPSEQSAEKLAHSNEVAFWAIWGVGTVALVFSSL